MKAIITIKNILNSKAFFIVFFGFYGLLTLAIAIMSLKWIIGLDLQPVLFAAYLTDKFHMIPYKDFFYYNFPAVHLFYLILIKIFGYSYFGVRIADLIYLTATLTISFFIFKKISIISAICGIIVFSLIYFAGQNYYSLQRDFILILPIILSILIFSIKPNEFIKLKSLAIGFLCICSALIKPHAIIFFPFVLLFHFIYNSEEKSKLFSFGNILNIFLFSFIGAIIPISITLLYLWSSGSLTYFWDIFINFMTFYRNSKAAIVSDPSIAVDNSIIRYIKMGGYRPFAIPALIGFILSYLRIDLDRKQKLIIYLFGTLSIVSIIYVLIAAKLMTYYWIPFAYFAIFLGSTCIIENGKFTFAHSDFYELISLIILYLIITIQVNRYDNRVFFINVLKANSNGNDSPKALFPDILKTADFLKANLKPGDKVLPLDDVGNGKHAMVLANAAPATYYIDECVLAFGEREFPSSEYLHKLHIDYMYRFNLAKPRFVIDFSGAKHYDDLQKSLDSNYYQIKLEHATIYLRKID